MPGGAPLGGAMGELVVEFAATGGPELKAAIDGIGYALQKDEGHSQSMAKAFVAAFEQGAAGAVVAARQTTDAGEKAKDLATKTEKADKALKGWADTAKGLGRTFQTVFAAASASVLGLVTAGTAGTVEGNRLAYAWERLSREMAAVFLPAIEAVTGWLLKAAQWFRELTAGQQNLILALAGTTAALFLVGKAAVALFANPMLAGVLALVGVFTLLSKAIIDARGQTDRLAESLNRLRRGQATKSQLESAYEAAGIKKGDTPEQMAAKAEERMRAMEDEVKKAREWLAKPAYRLGGAARKDMTDTVEQYETLGEVGRRGRRGETLRATADADQHRQLHPAPTGFESIAAAYQRIQLSITKKDPVKVAEEQLKATEEGNGTLVQIATNLLRLAGSVVPAG